MLKQVLTSLLVAGACSAVLADAVQIDFVGALDKSVEYVRLDGKNIGVYTGLYSIKVDGEQTTTYCIDPLGEIHNGDSWEAQHFSAEDIAAGNGLLFNDQYSATDDLAREKYAMISYLANQSFSLYTDNPSASLDEKAERSDLSLMYWEIAVDYDGSLGSLDLSKYNGEFYTTNNKYGNGMTLLAEAYEHRNDAIDIAIYSTPDRPSQEFLAIKKVSVPEPASMIMLLMGLGCLAGVQRRRTKR
jgi:hypothetical protein